MRLAVALLETARCVWCGGTFKRSDPKVQLCPRCEEGVPR